MNTQVGSRVEPGQCLIVEIFQVTKMQAWPEVAPHIFYAILDLTLRLWPIRFAGLRGKSCHIGKVQKTGIPMDHPISVPTLHYAFEVIVEESAAARLPSTRKHAGDNG